MICIQSVKKYCENFTEIENYNEAMNDSSKTWICHHKLEAFFTEKELKDMGRYYNVQPRELVFCKDVKAHRTYPHKGWHNNPSKFRKGVAHPHSEKARRNMSISLKAYYANKVFTEEERDILRKNRLGKKMSEESKTLISCAMSKLKWYTNGIENHRCMSCPEGYWPGRTKL